MGNKTTEILNVKTDGDISNPVFIQAPAGEITVLVQDGKATRL